MEEEHIIQQVVPVYVLELNNGVLICWLQSGTYTINSNTSTNFVLNLPSTYNTTYRPYHSHSFGSTNWARTQAMTQRLNNSQVRILCYCHDHTSPDNSWQILTIGY